MAERIISERVVSRRVVGSANPIAKKFRNLKGSITGVGCGPILIVLALGILFYGEKFQRSSKIVEQLSLETAEEVTATEGLHMMSGKPTVTTPAEAPEVGNVLYYYYAKQEYQEVEETEYETVTGVENGQEVEEDIERVKIVEKWVDKETESKWAEFKLGNYEVKTAGADLKLDLSKKEYREDLGVYYELTSAMSSTPALGDYRLVVDYLTIDEELLVVGQISGSTISSGGEVYIITTKTDAELLSDMKTEETAIYWVTKGATWLLLTIGLLMMIGPILSLLDFIPIAGQAANCAASVIAAVISVGIVLAGTLIIRYWWICLGLSVIGVISLVVLLVVLVMKKGSSSGTPQTESGKSEPKAEEVAPGAEAA
jgi:VIT1/CCC1 family predicted Fe2+/Mn2+ transporter